METNLIESPDMSTESGDSIDSETVSEAPSLEIGTEVITSEEVEQLLPEELAVDEEVTSEIIYESSYSPADLSKIEGSLQIIACLLVVIVIYIVLRVCKYIVDTIF